MRYQVMVRFVDGLETTVHDHGALFSLEEAEELLRAARRHPAYAALDVDLFFIDPVEVLS